MWNIICEEWSPIANGGEEGIFLAFLQSPVKDESYCGKPRKKKAGEKREWGGISWRGGDLQREMLVQMKCDCGGSVYEGRCPIPTSWKAGVSAIWRTMV